MGEGRREPLHDTTPIGFTAMMSGIIPGQEKTQMREKKRRISTTNVGELHARITKSFVSVGNDGKKLSHGS